MIFNELETVQSTLCVFPNFGKHFHTILYPNLGVFWRRNFLNVGLVCQFTTLPSEVLKGFASRGYFVGQGFAINAREQPTFAFDF
jgi:hypothetical protein